MSGLLRRIRRPGAAEETRTEATTAPAPAHGSAPANPAPSEGGQRLPAGAAPEDAERRAITGRRGRLRRRARFLRRARELALRDLGGLVYEARRREQDPGKLAEDKVQRLIALDVELHELDAVLGTPRGETVLREPGVGGTCARCGELHGSEATFCANCGANLAEAAAAETERRAVAEKAAADKAAAEKAEADKAKAAKAAADKAEADRPAADTPEAEKAETDGAGNGSIDKPGSGNGRIDSEAPTEVAEPATTPDRPA
jgi:predicted  nucleic acid-binding Zn-ribbon protein